VQEQRKFANIISDRMIPFQVSKIASLIGEADYEFEERIASVACF
jgi:hypothetical protein